MNGSDLAVSLTLKLNDQGSGAAQRALKLIERALKDVETTAKSTGAAAISAFKKLADSREILGIRSEKAIQNEIRQTEAAYKRLVASGQAGARELSRAQDAMRAKVQALRQEMEGASRAGISMGGALRGFGGMAAGAMAGRAVLAGPVGRTMDYSMEMAHAANVLYAGKSASTRIAGKAEINTAVMTAVREAKGGVSREDALAGVKTLAASGEFGNDPRTAYAMLPSIAKAAAANNSTTEDMANIAIKAKQTMGLTNTGRILDMAAQGGISGSFELRSMAKWLPQQMAYARRTGLVGEEGFATLVAANQVSMRTAGSADEAGNNLKNLLGKVNSADTANDFKKLGIDLSGTLAAAQKKGVGGLDAFLNLTDQVAAKDPRLVKLREQAKTAKGDDLRANLEAQQGILEGSSIGKVVQDAQAMAALVALLNGRGDFDKIRKEALGASGTNDDLLKVVGDEAAAKAQLLAAESANAMQTALDKVNPLLGGAADGLAGLMKEFPVLSAVIAGGGTAVAAMAASATAASIALAALTKSAGGKLLPELPGLPGGGGGNGGGAGGTASKWLSRVKAGGAAVLPLAAMYGVSEWAGDTSNDVGRTSALTGLSSTLSGLFGDPTAKARKVYEDRRAELEPQEVRVTVDVQNGNIVAAVNQANAREAVRK